MPPSPVRACEGDQITWERSPDPTRKLALWCSSVGVPVVQERAAGAADTKRLVILSWNVHVGGGRIQEVVELIRRRTPTPPGGTVGIVLLLQEVFRGGSEVPEAVPAGMKAPKAIRPERPAPDIVDVARNTGLSLAYVPSMRNGAATGLSGREDRGSAILSSEPLSGVTAIELPFGRQRRVAVMATVTGAGIDTPRLRVITGHLDVVRGARDEAATLAAYVRSIDIDDTPIVLGIDTNAMFGGRDAVIRIIERVLPRVRECGAGRTSRWIARVDFVFSNLGASFRRQCETLSDRYGSDHAPVLLTLDF